MQTNARCKKCGRILRDPESIARGMGPKCTGISNGGRGINIRTGRQSGSVFGSGVLGSAQTTLFIEDTSPKHLSKKEMAKQNREKRRRLFEERLPFQCGLLLPERKPIVYIPTVDGGWMNSTSGHSISHERLQSYLKQYQFI